MGEIKFIEARAKGICINVEMLIGNEETQSMKESFYMFQWLERLTSLNTKPTPLQFAMETSIFFLGLVTAKFSKPNAKPH